MNTPDTPPPVLPSIADLHERVRRLEFQAGAILYLSGVNLFLNAIMVCVSALIAWS
jgi:hypothetical protein